MSWSSKSNYFIPIIFNASIFNEFVSEKSLIRKHSDLGHLKIKCFCDGIVHKCFSRG